MRRRPTAVVEDEQAGTDSYNAYPGPMDMFVRFDDEGGPRHTTAQAHLLAHLEQEFPRCDVIIISYYTYGVVSDASIQRRVLQMNNPNHCRIHFEYLYRLRDVGATVVIQNLPTGSPIIKYKQAAGQRC